MINKTLLCTLLMFSLSLYCDKDYTLSDLIVLSKKYPRSVAPDNTDFYNPIFNSYFAAQRPSAFKRLTNFLGITANPLSIRYLIKILKEVIETQKSRGRWGDYVMGTQLAPEQKIIIFGNIQGAFHSLIHDLQELKHQNIIDEQLRITDQRYYIIFNGSVVSRSAEPLQTLLIVLLLMQRNPDNVICLESDFERGDQWKNRGFAQQINSIYPEHRDEIFYLFRNFIEIMPFAFYANFKETPEKLLKFTTLQELEHESIENDTGDFFFTLRRNALSTRQLNNKEKILKSAHVHVLINGLTPTIKDTMLNALMYLYPHEVASVWRVFSAPTAAFQKAYNFTQDAFACIVCDQSLESSIIELFSRNTDSNDSFKLARFNIISGVEIQEKIGRSKSPVYIASALDFSQANYHINNDLVPGIHVAALQANRREVLPNNIIKPAVFETTSLSGAYDNYQMLKDNLGIRTFLLAADPTTLQVAGDDIRAGAILHAFPVIAAPEYRNPNLKGIINFTPSYVYELEVLLNLLVKQYHLKTFAFFYKNDDYGIGVLHKAKEILKKLGIDDCIALPYTSYTNNFDKQCEFIKTKHPEALGFFSDSSTCQEFIRQTGVMNLLSTQLFALSLAGDETFSTFLKDEMGLSCIYTRVTPNPRTSMLPIVQEYRSLMDEQGQQYTSFGLLAYICTSILCDTMRRTKAPITHSALIEEFEKLNGYNFKGLTLRFDSQDRQISKRVWLDLQDGKDWQEIVL